MRPEFTVAADGEDVTARLRDRLLGLTLTDEAGLTADTLTLRLDDRDGRIETPRTGAELEVALGFAGQQMTRLGRFRVEGVSGEGPVQTMTVTAASADLTSAIRAPRTQGWTDTTLAEVLGEIAARNGLTATIAGGLGAHAYPHVAQTAESDLNLVTRLAEDLGAVAKIAERTLIVAPAGGMTTASGRPLPVVDLAMGDLTAWRWRLGTRTEYASCTCYWHDRATGERRPVTAGAGDPAFEVRRTMATEDQARRTAEGRLASLNRARFGFSARLAGFFPDIVAEGPIRISGAIRPDLGRLMLVTRVTHRLGDGLVTEIEAEDPPEDKRSD